MLQAIRSKAGSWIVKILFIVLILSFGVWGIGDMVRQSGVSNTVAEVGPAEITRADLDQEFRRQMERLRPLFGGNLTAEQARQFGLLDQALTSLVQQRLYDLAARDAGIVVPDALIRQRIAEEPAFRDGTGVFSPGIFQAVLRNNNLTEAGFVALMREQIAQSILGAAVTTGVTAPKPLVEALYRRRGEQRVAEIVTIPNDGTPGDGAAEVGTPDAAAVQKYYEDHPVRFTAPEYRALTVARLSVDDVARDLAVGDEELRGWYEDHLAEFQSPERRTLRMAVVDSEDKAKALAAKARTDGIEAAARDAGVDAVALDKVARDELPELGDAAFTLAEGAVGDPVRTALGWHVLAVTAIEPGTSRPLAEVKDEIAARIRHDKGLDLVYEVSNRIDDALAAGTPLEEVASKEGLGLIRLAAVDATGKTPDGTGATGVANLPKVLETGFGLASGQTSGLVEAGNDAFLVVRVDSITAPALRPLDAVRDEVVAAWTAEQRQSAAVRKAEQIAAALKAGAEGGAQTLAENAGGSFALTAPFTRDARAVEGLSPALVAQLFEVQPEEVVTGTVGDAQVVARLKEIIPADPAAAGSALAPVERSLIQGIQSDLAVQFAQALQARYPVEVNNATLQQMYPQSN